MAHGYTHKRQQRNTKNQSISAPFGLQVPASLRDPQDATFSDIELIRLSNDDNARDFALSHLHNHEQFAALWNSTTIRPNTRRWMRKVVQIQTINAVCNGFYRLPDTTKINLDKSRMARSAQNTKQYENVYNYDRDLQQRTYEQPSTVFVVDGDCLDVLMCFKNRYPQSNPVVLNMASSKNPGGGWKNGAGAQEENLHRRTNMFQCLEDPYHELDIQRDWNYHIPEFGGIYSPNVSIFRGSESNGYPFFPDGPKYISFIACSAYSHPPTETDQNGELKLSGKNVIENTKKKMKTILNIALDNKHDIIILSAIGCGAFQNPPKHIAQLFHEVITKEYSKSFKCIVFAIINDHNCNKAHNPTGNIQPFAEIFQVDALSIDELQQKLSQSIE
ncbi:unnamed protein product [Adineta steineri]|uniref:Microbial-type PARG catalytic domain-containing protein n=1 Tax=Adineta steineri TaxID=433720 RepID=A0A813PNI3_9BILA|nr:unnamed protein product [Adineta steineri]CAF0807978.1 unnamed protein product [Adineta steineri]CAF3540096.1 unnamed protein product [Adineta steineri]CAF4007981.1 unnamed protein product [Adineta steineri]